MIAILSFVLNFLSSPVLAQNLPVPAAFAPVHAQNFSESLVVENVPPVMSQDSLGVCYAYAGSVVLTAENCRHAKAKCSTKSAENCDSAAADCTKTPEENIFSPLALANFASIGEGIEAKPGFVSGGHTANVLAFITELENSAPSEACFSLDKILSKLGGAKSLATVDQVAYWKKLQSHYEAFRKNQAKCPDCAQKQVAAACVEIEKLGVKKDSVAILKAFQMETYDEFLSELFSSRECMRARNKVFLEGDVTVESLPPAGSKSKSNYNEGIGKIKDVLGQQRPIVLSNLCLDEPLPKNRSKCQNQHALVITGFRQVCSSANKCKDVVKIQNSWGQSWQESLKGSDQKPTDSWVDARTLLDHTDYSEAYLTWLQERR